MHDIRRAGYLESDLRVGRQTFTPQISYSRESDYESIGLSLGYTLGVQREKHVVVSGCGA